MPSFIFTPVHCHLLAIVRDNALPLVHFFVMRGEIRFSGLATVGTEIPMVSSCRSTRQISVQRRKRRVAYLMNCGFCVSLGILYSVNEGLH